MSLKITVSTVLLASLLSVQSASALVLSDHPKLQSIANELIAEQHYTKDELDTLFASAEIKQSVIDAMTNPAEYRLTWGKYRKIFLGQERIEQGIEFWQEYQSHLERAEREYGVPAHIIVAIIGVETKFGRITGKHRVLDSLSTLVTGYERRSAFFGRELKEFLILTKENKLDATSVLGSYAGAVGFPQFISSSYRAYAVDFSGDGRADLINDPVDAIGSVANYFIKNGWKPGKPVTSPAHQNVPSEIADIANRKRKTLHTAGSLRAKGAQLDPSITDDEKLNVVMLNASEIVPDSTDREIYIVRAGDTACEIAERNSVSCKSLFALNKLNNNGAIFRGQRLKLPPKEKGRSKSSENSKESSSTDSVGQKADSKWEVGSTSEPAPVKNTTMMPRYFYTHHNFYAITEYNHSVLYAMAVHDLSVELMKLKQVKGQ